MRTRVNKSKANTWFDLMHELKDHSGQEIAREAGVSPTTISNWRSRESTLNPRWDTLTKVAHAYGYDFKLVRSNH